MVKKRWNKELKENVESQWSIFLCFYKTGVEMSVPESSEKGNSKPLWLKSDGYLQNK